MKVIIHADDFGVSFGVNEAIEKAFKFGTLTSTSIRTNGVAYENAVVLLKKDLKKIGLGLHLNLTDGKTHLSALANKSSSYKYSFPEYILRSANPDIKNKIENELDEQFRIVNRSGLILDHVDGQDHIHMIPTIFEIVCKLCVKHKVKAIRLAHEPWYTMPSTGETLRPIINGGALKASILSVMSSRNNETLKRYNLVTTDAYFGVLHTNFMTTQAFNSIVKYSNKANLSSIEIACHPGIPRHKKDTKYTSPFFEFYGNLPSRKMELETLTSKSLKKTLEEGHVSLSRFSDLLK